MASRPRRPLPGPATPALPAAVTRGNSGDPSYIAAAALAMPRQALPKKPAKPVKKNHSCDVCGKAFRDVYHLNRHKLSHSDEKPFECPVCHQRFKRKDRMTYHARAHDGGVHKPYVCSVCGKGFSRPDHLSCHVKHVHSAERPFKCQVMACTSAFATKDRLRSHMTRHEGKVTCTICGKMLSAAYISSHLKTHGQAAAACNSKGELTVREILNKSLQVLIDHRPRDASSATPTLHAAAVTSATHRSAAATPVATATQRSVTAGTLSITSAVSLQHPVGLASVNIPTTAQVNLAHPVAIGTPVSMNIAAPLNIAMRPVEGVPFLSQVLPSSPPW